MLIKSIQFKNFKRFSDLTIDLDPTNSGQIPKLVLLIGANGSGKSSVFDGFELMQNILNKKNHSESAFYYFSKDRKNPSTLRLEPFKNTVKHLYGGLNFFENQEISLKYGLENIEKDGLDKDSIKFYSRTAFRNIKGFSSFNALNFGRVPVDEVIKQNLDNPENFTKEDGRIGQDVLYATGMLDTADVENIKNQINEYLRDIFTNPESNKVDKNYFQIKKMKRSIVQNSWIDLDVEIQKKEVVFNYENLSSGEKQLLNILFNLLVRKPFLENCIVYLDEIDLHLHTALQSQLLKIISQRVIPENSQLWTASHSLGFIEYAREYQKGAIIDFDNLDFDLPQKLQPIKNFDLQIYEVSIPKQSLGKILLDQEIYFCEGKNDEIYNILGFEKTIFIGGKARNKDEVLFELKNTKYKGIIDRDYLIDLEILDLKKEYNDKLFVLDFYAIENYLYHWENLLEIDSNFNIQEYKQEILKAKKNNLVNMEISASRRKYRCLKKYSTEKLAEETAKIKEILNSDEIEVFYSYFDLKKYLNPKPNFEISQLVQTQWFKNQIQNIIQN